MKKKEKRKRKEQKNANANASAGPKRTLKTTNASMQTCIETQMLKAVEVRFPPIPRHENRS